MRNLIKIADKELQVKEWEGQRVVTSYDIAKLHERDVREVNQNFNNNRDKFILGEDYFIVSKSDISESKFLIQEFIPNNVKEIPLFTESGYLMLVKTFTDSLSWIIQRMLVKSYFTLKETKPLTQAELILQQAQWMVEAENRLGNIESKVVETNQNMATIEKGLSRLEHNQRRTITSNHLTVIAYANMKGISPNSYNSSVIGRKATKLSKKKSLPIGTVVDSKYGYINTYSMEILDEIFFG